MTNSDIRLKALNILANDYTFTIHPNKIKTWDKSFRINEKERQQPYLADDKNGNILIHYPSITDAAGIEYYVTDKSFDFYTRRRWHNPAEHGGARYASPSGSGIKIFIPKKISKRRT
jgi:hypothetical protein